MAEVKRMEPEAQLDGFIAKFAAQNQKLIRALRQALRRRLPQANELVYDNYNFLVLAYCPSERTQDSYFSLGANAHGVNLFFGYNGSTLPDPRGLLQGSGKLNRFIRLESAKHLAHPEVQALVSAAIASSKVPLVPERKGQLIIRAISPKQRPRDLVTSPRARR
jgi:hypothetical protein